MKRYINMRGESGVETICEYEGEEIKGIKHVLLDYRESDPKNEYYISRRCTNDWKNK